LVIRRISVNRDLVDLVAMEFRPTSIGLPMKSRNSNLSKTFIRIVSLPIVLVFLAFSALSSTAAQQPGEPVFDVHWHLPPNESMESVSKALNQLNVTYAVAIGTQIRLKDLKPATGITFIPSLTFPCENGKLANIGTACFANAGMMPDLNAVREAVKRGDVKSLGEINAQYLGLAPNDARLEPYFALAEELDIPVGIHLGIGPPGVSYNNPGFPPVKSPSYNAKSGDPLLLEEVLKRHPKLRLYAQHAAYPFGDNIVYMLYMHPQLYVDISVLQWAIPRPAYYSYLKRLVDAGFAKRIMFGSDGSIDRLREGIDAINNADFITADQKRDILFNNAARFFKLPANNR
jgi:hypothetical protein